MSNIRDVRFTAVRAITEGHGAVLESSACEVRVKLPLGGVTRLLTEFDGSMVPTPVQTGEDQGDKRRQRKVS